MEVGSGLTTRITSSALALKRITLEEMPAPVSMNR